MAGDDYVEVDVTITMVRPKSILVTTPDNPNGAWLPRSTIYGPHEITLNRMGLPESMALKVSRWVAQREGLI